MISIQNLIYDNKTHDKQFSDGITIVKYSEISFFRCLSFNIKPNVGLSFYIDDFNVFSNQCYCYVERIVSKYFILSACFVRKTSEDIKVLKNKLNDEIRNIKRRAKTEKTSNVFDVIINSLIHLTPRYLLFDQNSHINFNCNDSIISDLINSSNKYKISLFILEKNPKIVEKIQHEQEIEKENKSLTFIKYYSQDEDNNLYSLFGENADIENKIFKDEIKI